eukprot:2067893-Pyramimonas_sp.AAC.1
MAKALDKRHRGCHRVRICASVGLRDTAHGACASVRDHQHHFLVLPVAILGAGPASTASAASPLKNARSSPIAGRRFTSASNNSWGLCTPTSHLTVLAPAPRWAML